MGANPQCCCQEKVELPKTTRFDDSESVQQVDDSFVVVPFPVISEFSEGELKSNRKSDRQSVFVVGRKSLWKNSASTSGLFPASDDELLGEGNAQTQSFGDAIGSDCGVPKRRDNRYLSTIAAGHEQSILKDWRQMGDEPTGIPDYVMKVYDEFEARAYEHMKATNDPLRSFTPEYFGEVPPEDIDHEETRRFVRLSNLFGSFQKSPHVMDCKLGCRSFAEDEATNTKLRPDLFTRMLALDSSEPTAEEKAQQAITKYRWMTFNDKLTNMSGNYYRIDGISFSSGARAVPKAELKRNFTLADNASCIVRYFLPTLLDVPSCTVARLREMHRTVAETILSRLRCMRDCIKDSSFAAWHSFVGSSALFIVDAHGPCATVNLIDFAKTIRVPDGVHVDHTSSWNLGNHEDGLLNDIDNLIKTWQLILDMVSR